MVSEPDPVALTAMQYLIWALELIEQNGDGEAARHTRLALAALGKYVPKAVFIQERLRQPGPAVAPGA
jgi:hypothetical protein